MFIAIQSPISSVLFVDVLKGIAIPETVLHELVEELKQSSDKKYQHQLQASKKLQDQYQAIQNRVKRARELYLDADISKEEYDGMMTDLQAERHNIEVRLQRLTQADDGFNKAITTIFTLASKAHHLFKSSELEEQRQIIKILFPNLTMSAEKLVLKPRKPFDMFLNMPVRLEWLPGTGSNRRPIG